MFSKRSNTFIVVQGNEVYWVSTDRSGKGRVRHRAPLASVLENPGKVVSAPDLPKGRRSSLCILPNHWFSSETFPFRAQKASLIEPYLERKLAASYPERPFAHRFYAYKTLSGGEEAPGLCVHFLHDESGHRLYEGLSRAGHAPLKITAPAFLWEDRLRKTVSGFPDGGVLLLDTRGPACELYFYFKGNYLFSRSVVLPDGTERIRVLIYEVNQSLYLFSQKTRSDLDRIYLLGDGRTPLEELREGVGRDVVDLQGASEAAAAALQFGDAPALNGLLPLTPSESHRTGFAVMHRDVRRALEWKPVQTAGIAIGLALVLALAGERWALGRVLRDARIEGRQVHSQALALGTGDLSESAVAVDRVLLRMERPDVSVTALRVLDSLPAEVRLDSFELVMEPDPSLALRARVEARDMEHLSTVLSQLVDRINRRFHGGEAVFSIRDVDIGGDPAEAAGGRNQYRIAFSIDPT